MENEEWGTRNGETKNGEERMRERGMGNGNGEMGMGNG